MRTCPSCNRHNPEDAKFCNNCATPLVSEESTQKDAPSVSSIEPKATQPLEQVHLQDTNRFESETAAHSEDLDESGELVSLFEDLMRKDIRNPTEFVLIRRATSIWLNYPRGGRPRWIIKFRSM